VEEESGVLRRACGCGWIGVTLVLALALGGCLSRPRSAYRDSGDPCQKLAYTFYLVAEFKQRGTSRAAQERIARKRVGRSPEALDQWLHVVDLVYRYADGAPYEIGATVLDACQIGPGGKAAVVSTLWPAR
jgi:hypothetical protein